MASSPLCFVFTVLVLLVLMANAHGPSYINYTTIAGYFLQDDPLTNSSTLDYTAVNLGLINRTYDTDGEYGLGHQATQWQRFARQVFRLNHESGRHVQYKVLYMGRHGEGYHNVAESFYGTPAWDCYWSKQDGNATVTWADAHLTENGIQQARKANAFWANRIATEKIPVAESYYTSPLDRCLATANITFSDLELPSRHPFVPEVKELLREAIGIHTCDRRSTKSHIHAAYPTFTVESHFAESDPLWTPNLRESDSALDARLKRLLDDVFAHDDATFISFTSHSGAIASILRVLDHQPFGLVTGGVIPVLVRAEKVYATPPSTSIAASTPAPTCTANPTASP